MSAVRVTHLDHCTVLVTDVEKARAFYGGLLGLTEVPPPREFDFPAVWYDLGGQYLHLLLKPQPDSPSPRHFCLHVADAAAAREFFRTRGVPVDETVRIGAADRFFVRDPDGNRIELLQWERPYRPDADGRYQVWRFGRAGGYNGGCHVPGPGDPLWLPARTTASNRRSAARHRTRGRARPTRCGRSRPPPASTS